MERFDMVLIDIDVADIVELLQDKVRRIVQEMHAWVIICCGQETLKRRPIMQIFSWMNFVCQVHSVFFRDVQDWLPALCQLFKAHLDQSLWTLGPGIYCMPEQCAGER